MPREDEAAWLRAETKFRDAYGSEADLNDDRTDRPLFLALLEEEIRTEITARLTTSISAAAERIRAIDSDAPRAA